MKLRTIAANHLKGKSFTHSLEPVQMITGANDAGKSAIADAVRLVLLGHLPEHGKTNVATFTLSSSSKLDVEGVFETETGNLAVRREWKKSGKTIKATAENDSALPETPLVMLNANEFFGRTDRQRTDMLFSVLKVDKAKWTRDGVRNTLRAAQDEGTLGDFDALTQDKRAGDPNEDSGSMDEWINNVAARLADEQSKATAEAGRFEKTSQGITQMRVNEAPLDPAAVEREEKDNAAAILDREKTKSTLEAEARTAGANDTRRGELTKAIAQCDAVIGAEPAGDKVAIQHEIEQAVERQTVLRAAYDTAQREYATASQANERRQGLELRIAQLGGQPAGNPADVVRLEAEAQAREPFDVAAANRAVEEAIRRKASVAGQVSGIDAEEAKHRRKYEERMRTKCCPECGGHADDWAKLVEEALETALGEIQSQRAAVEREYAVATRELEEAQANQTRHLELEKRSQQIERNLAEARRLVREGEQRAQHLASIRDDLSRIPVMPTSAPAQPTELVELGTRIEGLRAQQRRAEAAERRAQLQQELGHLGAAAPDHGEAIYRIECELETLNELKTEIAAKKQKVQNQLADDRRLAEAQTEREKALTRERLLKILREKLNAERETMINEAFAPLLKVVNRFTAGILPQPLEFRDGELGRFVGAAWVPVSAFGGTHMAATHAGLQAALGATAPAKIVIVDEMGRFDAVNKLKFLSNVAAAVKEGVIDQFIGIDCDPEPYREAVAQKHVAMIEVGK